MTVTRSYPPTNRFSFLVMLSIHLYLFDERNFSTCDLCRLADWPFCSVTSIVFCELFPARHWSSISLFLDWNEMIYDRNNLVCETGLDRIELYCGQHSTPSSSSTFVTGCLINFRQHCCSNASMLPCSSLFKFQASFILRLVYTGVYKGVARCPSKNLALKWGHKMRLIGSYNRLTKLLTYEDHTSCCYQKRRLITVNKILLTPLAVLYLLVSKW